MFSSEVNLSERQRQVLRYLAAGMTAAETGKRLYLSPHTVRIYRGQLFEALGVRNAPQAVAVAYELGILPLAG